jgi:hypothetical protein
MTERGLSLYRIDPAIRDRVPKHGPPACYRPGWLDEPMVTRPAVQQPLAMMPAAAAWPALGRPTLYGERVAASGLSLWELGDLLGIYPHQPPAPRHHQHRPVPGHAHR